VHAKAVLFAFFAIRKGWIGRHALLR
jgi:hypothetical protein